MSINLTLPDLVNEPELKPRITVIGVGGAGGNAVNNMIASNLGGVEFVVANTDSQALSLSRTDRRIQMGLGITNGLGAGANPDVGQSAAQETLDQIMAELEGSNMVFVAAGMGGGTGTGAAPVIAQTARERGILTVGVVTKPFHFEGAHRMRLAEAGIERLQDVVDTLIIIPNQNLFRVANEKTTFADAFKMADDVLYSGVRSVTDLMVMPGLINLDFADVRAVMSNMGKAMMGTGEAEGEKRSLDAAEAAISNPLLEDTSIQGAQGVLINITGGPDMTLFEVDEAANRIRDEVDHDAHIIFGSTFDEQLEGKIRVSVVATGIDVEEAVRPQPRVLELRGRAEAKPAPQPAPQPATVVTAQAAPAPVQAAAPAPAATMKPAMPEAKPAPAPAPQPELKPQAAPQMSATPVAAAPARPAPAVQAPAPTVAEPVAEAEPKTAEMPFIPPAPAEASRARYTKRDADPFNQAAVENAPAEIRQEHQTRPQRQKVSLFERVTRVARPAKPEVEVTESQPAPVAEEKPRQHQLLPGERSVTSSYDEDDLLDIPAFLRRQAN
ncbi:MAG: cell division protein FtsZ [Magnetospiraceae bacterium]